MNLAGVIFDLDGTLVDSRLDFAKIRNDMGLKKGLPILEALAEMEEGDQKEQCLVVLRQHELAGAEQACFMPGAAELLAELDRRRLRHAVLTRNSRESTNIVIERLGLHSAPVLTREDAPAKPDPAGLLQICQDWNSAPSNVLFVGDFLFDIRAGQNAGMKTVLYAPAALPDYADEADFTIRDFAELVPVINEFASR